MYQSVKKLHEHGASVFLLLLLSADFAFTGLHIVKHAFVERNSILDIQISAYTEIYHLLKLFWAVVLFAYLQKLTRCFGYGSWILVFLFFLVDDAFLLHQKLGDLIAGNWDGRLLFSLRSQPRLFELAILIIAWVILLVIIAWAYSRNRNSFRNITKDMLLFVGALFFFGIIADLAGAINLGSVVLLGLDIIEDAGENVVLSLILWYAFLLIMRKGKLDFFLLDLLGKPKITTKPN